MSEAKGWGAVERTCEAMAKRAFSAVVISSCAARREERVSRVGRWMLEAARMLSSESRF